MCTVDKMLPFSTQLVMRKILYHFWREVRIPSSCRSEAQVEAKTYLLLHTALRRRRFAEELPSDSRSAT